MAHKSLTKKNGHNHVDNIAWGKWAMVVVAITLSYRLKINFSKNQENRNTIHKPVQKNIIVCLCVCLRASIWRS